MAVKVKGRFIEPMLLLRTDALPDDGGRWAYQLKLDGYRAVAFKTGGKLHLRSRNDNDFSLRYPDVVKGLAKLPDETVIDGEVVALDEEAGRRSTSCRTTARRGAGRVLRLRRHGPGRPRRDGRAARGASRAVGEEGPAEARGTGPVRRPLDATLPVLIESVKAQGLEGLVAKRATAGTSRDCDRARG